MLYFFIFPFFNYLEQLSKNKNKVIDFDKVIVEGERCVMFAFKCDGHGGARKDYSSITANNKRMRIKVLSDVFHFLNTGSIEPDLLNDFYHYNSDKDSPSKALVLVEDTVTLVALRRLSFNKMETIRAVLLKLGFNLFPCTKLIKRYLENNNYPMSHQIVPFVVHNPKDPLYEDGIAFVRTNLREFLVKRCEALMTAGNLKIIGRAISSKLWPLFAY
uniref:BTB domain-containing protein n=1 Tax=Rhabditophanes sp. KR3021 TaxID=114890 RepID=A0AC35UIR8_9BILA